MTRVLLSLLVIAVLAPIATHAQSPTPAPSLTDAEPLPLQAPVRSPVSRSPVSIADPAPVVPEVTQLRLRASELRLENAALRIELLRVEIERLQADLRTTMQGLQVDGHTLQRSQDGTWIYVPTPASPPPPQQDRDDD